MKPKDYMNRIMKLFIECILMIKLKELLTQYVNNK